MAIASDQIEIAQRTHQQTIEYGAYLLSVVRQRLYGPITEQDTRVRETVYQEQIGRLTASYNPAKPFEMGLDDIPEMSPQEAAHFASLRASAIQLVQHTAALVRMANDPDIGITLDAARASYEQLATAASPSADDGGEWQRRDIRKQKPHKLNDVSLLLNELPLAHTLIARVGEFTQTASVPSAYQDQVRQETRRYLDELDNIGIQFNFGIADSLRTTFPAGGIGPKGT